VELIIAEKPSVARDLARVLGMRPSGKGAYEGNGRVITWCVGHLVELEEPAAYDGRWKAWRLETLPMLPTEFKLRPAKHGADQLKIVTAFLRDRRFDSVVNACDAGREGELIFRYLIQYAGRPLPAKRLWISSLTDDAIRRGFAALRLAAQFDALGDAARARSEADWLVGMNATRAVTVRLRGAGGDSLFSIGRVQTPTLAMLVAKENAIRMFVPRDYWEVHATLCTRGAQRFSAKWSHGRATQLDGAKLADGIVARCSAHAAIDDPKGPRVERVRERTVREAPPMLFDLTSLQRTANRRFGFSAQRTLDLAQALYERRKVLTYPRTDSRHLTSDVAKELPKLFAALGGVPDYAPFVAQLTAHPPRPSRRVVDDGKVSDHHAIIPTGKPVRLDDLDGDERRLFDLVARRFLGVFYPDAEFAVTEAVIRVGGPGMAPPDAVRTAQTQEGKELFVGVLPPPPDWFVARGRVRLAAGWQAVAGIDGTDKERGYGDGRDDAEWTAILPPLVEGQPLEGAFEPLAKKTQPPRRYTEASLLSAMESAGKTLSDEELRAAMKDTGLGTPATRAAIIETLLKRGYAQRDNKLIVPTATGMALIAALPVPSLASPELTGEWEARLERIARGTETRLAFMTDIAAYVRNTVEAIRVSEPSRLIVAVAADAPAVGRCACCGGAVREGARAFACSGCGFAMRKKVAGRAISAKLASVLLAKRRSDVLRGFRSKGGTKFAAALVLQDDGELHFSFDGAGGKAPTRPRAPSRPLRSSTTPSARPRAAAKPGAAAQPISELVCPRCNRGTLVAGKRGWGCARWREGCAFVIWFDTAGRQLSEAQLRDLVLRGKTRRARFHPNGAAPIEGRLVLDPATDGGVLFVPG
jgi:DNA topoisomerase-3